MTDLNFLCATCLSNVEAGSASISDPMCDFLRNVLHFKSPLEQNSSKLVCRVCYKTLIELRRFCAQLRDVQRYFESKSTAVPSADKHDQVEHFEKPPTTPTESKTDIAEQMRLDPALIEAETVLVVKDKVIESKKNKLDHTKSISNGKPTGKPTGKRFVCLVCSKLFSSIQELRTHEILHFAATNDAITPVFLPTRQRPYACQICGLRFAFSKGLITHQKVHEYEKLKPFRCRKCNRRFPTEVAHRDHELIHTEVQMSQCEICGKKYYNEASLEAHMRMAHNCSTASAEVTVTMTDQVFQETM